MSEIVDHALEALLYEVVTQPKPGLVDPVDNGSHHDMDVFTFINSSVTMRPYLAQAEEIGTNFTGTDLTKMFAQLREAGKIAEKVMFQATNGVNTHKGAVFSLGIFVCAQSYAKQNDQNPFDVIRQMCAGLMEHDFKKKTDKKLTAGESQFWKYGEGGVREIAENGYIVIEKLALPYLRKTTGTTNQRLLDTLMMLATVTQDSTFIKRSGGMQDLSWLHQVAVHFLKIGGSKTDAGMDFLNQENQVFKRHNYSLGGCADLLIVTIFMALEENIL